LPLQEGIFWFPLKFDSVAGSGQSINHLDGFSWN
jgi:hypothetical protein